MRFGRIIKAAAVLALLAGCAKDVTVYRPEIKFQVAGYRSHSRAETADYKDAYSGVPFGAYAWYKAPDPQNDVVFMSNQKVCYDSDNNVWSPAGIVYYWPRNGVLDFICYSPYSADNGPQIGEDSILFSDYDVGEHPATDLLYADKAAGLTDNATTYYYSGVPVLFRHALARVRFRMRLAYWEQTASTGDRTKWEVELHSLTLRNLQTRGSLTLNLDNGSWRKPASGVWTASGRASQQVFDCDTLSLFTDAAAKEIGSSYVLPQMLDGVQAVLNMTIRTYRDSGVGYGSEPFIIERNVELPATLSTPQLTRWSINHSLTYTFVLAPSRGSGTGVDLDGDGLEDQEATLITFDPAVDDWQNVNINTGIYL